MDSLDEIAIKQGTDKSSLVHSYTKNYEQYFEPIRHESLKILEIGVQTGASLRMWKHYFPNAEIYGFDCYDCSPFEEDRITIFKGIQNNISSLEECNRQAGAFNIIIDDGSHKNPDVLACFEYFFPRMTPGGLYVIEDLNVCYWSETHNVGAPTAIERIKKLVDEVNCGGKSGIGDPKKDQQDGEYKRRGNNVTWWEKNVKYLHVYRSMAFIGRMETTY